MKSNCLEFFFENYKNIFVIVAASLVALVLLIANPGYFSHDELQKLDHLTRYGFAHYVSQYLAIHQTESFGTPVRPFSFFVQGVLAFAMEGYPVLVHLFSVLTHAAVACLLYVVALRLGASKSLGLTTALIFVVNPLAILATGWSAALMDRWYVLFGLVALIYADRYVRSENRADLLLWVFIFSALAMLSKETAIVLPGLMLLIFMVEPAVLRNKRYWLALAAWVVPVFLFMGFRLSSLITSFGNPQVSAYKASITNVPDGLLVYMAYPFVFTLTEAINWVFVDWFWIFAAIGFHVCLVVSLVRIYGIRVGGVYCILYFMFLAPVLFIPIKAAHYLYGSSLVLSVAVAVLLHQKWSGLLGVKAVGVYGVILLVLHSFVLQGFVYSIGSCMERAMTSTEALYLTHGRPQSVDFQAEPGAPEHILHRINTGREQIGAWFPVHLSVSPWGQIPPVNSLSLAMNSQCLVYVRQL